LDDHGDVVPARRRGDLGDLGARTDAVLDGPLRVRTDRVSTFRSTWNDDCAGRPPPRPLPAARALSRRPPSSPLLLCLGFRV